MIKAPAWAKGAHPTLRGWVRNGELLKGQKISQKDIDEWYGKEVAPAAPVVEPEPVVEAPVAEPKPEITEESLADLSKQEIDDLALEYDIELDRRTKKESMIQRFLNKIPK